jgi:hypothetical protein
LLGLPTSFQRRAPKRKPTIEDFPVEVEAPDDEAFPSSEEPQCRHCFSCPDRQRGLPEQEGSMIFGRIAPDVIF